MAGRRPCARLAQRHTVTAVEVTDPRELELPDVGHLTLVDPETGDLVDADTSDKRARAGFAAFERARRERVIDDLRRAQTHHVVLSTDGDWLRELGRVLR